MTQNVSLGLKPKPATPTGWPWAALAGFKTTNADGVPTVKNPVALCPSRSPTFIPYVPGKALAGTMTEPDTWPVVPEM